METLGTLLVLVFVGLVVLGPFVGVVLIARRHRRSARWMCRSCGYSKTGAVADRCPECGHDWDDDGGVGVPVRVERRLLVGLLLLYLVVLPMAVGLAVLLLVWLIAI